MQGWKLKVNCYLVGLLIVSFGVSLMVNSNLGVGPWDALFVGLAMKLGLTVGSWLVIIGLILILLNSFLYRNKPDFTAFLTIFVLGVLIDFWLIFVFSEIAIISIIVRVIFLLIGILLIAIGIALYLQANFAKNPIDNLMLAVQFRTGKSLTVSKTIIEVSALLLAFLVGGPIGLGTILVTFFIGPLIQIFHSPISKNLKF
ncbi:membrane protein [Anaerobacillus alkaliphilus]|uniref:Membrane protein n=1 Tax=Anaerobacillus alkaliphilus TaxID=1548597 RepID=A0A4Q0VTH0_9BACI|nr:membrane protein [Anaerobacillus alkaliphilus]RXJ01319.1 membrane protein [Anaerobacillus alkaliphilus]